MDTIDLTLPDFLRASNRCAPSKTPKGGGRTTWIMPKSASEKLKQRHTKELTEAKVSSDH